MLWAMTPVAGKEINKKGAKNCCFKAVGGLRSAADLDAQAGWVLLLRDGKADGVAVGQSRGGDDGGIATMICAYMQNKLLPVSPTNKTRGMAQGLSTTRQRAQV